MKLFGHTTMNVEAKTQITRTSDGLEVVLVLDNSGSMASAAGGGLTKIQALRASASSLVHILYGTATTIPNLWIGLVPFDSTVNLGSSAKSTWLHPSWLPFAGWPPAVVSVVSRHNPVKDTSDELATIFGYDLNSNYNASLCSTYSASATYYCAPTTFNASLCTAYTSWASTYCSHNYVADNIPPVTPMTASKQTVLDAIQLLVAYGNTYIDRGAAWGWHLLSPTWRGQWNAEMNSNGLPLDYSTPHMKKAIIIMTDGQNNYATSDTKLSQLCTNMKNEGINVYTITFGSVTGATLTVMTNCATSINHYFNAPTAAALNTAFNAIADSLSNLRVSK